MQQDDVMDSDDSQLSDGDLISIATNEAKVVISLTREGDSISGYIETVEGVEFDPGDEGSFSGSDLLRLAAELVLTEAGYHEDEVSTFLDTASRGPMELS